MKKYLLLFLLLQGIVLSAAASGTLCLTFDDRFFANWEKAIPFFKKYDARVTFFVYGSIDDNALKTMKKLQNAGHTIGLHSVNHLKLSEYLQENSMEHYMKNEIAPQLEVCRKNNINVRAFAYPFSQRTPETDKALFKEFDFLRTSWVKVRKNKMPLSKVDGCYVKNPASKQLFYGFPGSGRFDMAEVKKAMKRTAEEKSVLVFYAHDITEKIPPSHHIAISQLAELLEYAKSIDLSVRGLNEL